VRELIEGERGKENSSLSLVHRTIKVAWEKEEYKNIPEFNY